MRQPVSPRSTAAKTAWGGGVLLALAVVLHAPLLRCLDGCFVDLPGLHGRAIGSMGLADVRLNAWILASVQQNLAAHPVDLFAAKAFHPAPSPLTGSEHMLGLALLTLPLRAFTSDAVLVYQATAILTALLLAWGTFALVWWLTDSAPLGVLAGAVAMVMPWRWLALMHLQMLGAHWFPWIWLLTYRLALGQGGRRDAAILAVLVALQLLTSYYLAYGLSLSLVAIGAGAALQRALAPGTLGRLAAALAPGYALLAAVSIPYLQRRGAGELPAHFEAMALAVDALASATWRAIAPRLHFAWHGPPGAEFHYSVPLAVVALAVLAGAASLTRRAGGSAAPERWRLAARSLWLYAALAFALMLGPGLEVAGWDVKLPAYWASKLLPGFANLRAPWRWAVGIGIAAPVLAAIGLHWLARALPRRVGRTAFRGPLIALLVALLVANLSWGPIPSTPAWSQSDLDAYQALSALPDGPVLEVPWLLDSPRYLVHDSKAMLATTLHERPVLNGHTAYRPPSFQLLRSVGRRLPAPEAIDTLVRAAGLRWILLRPGSLAPEARERWRRAAAAGSLRLARDTGDVWIYEITSDGRRGDWMTALASDAPRDTTASGGSRARLALRAPAGRLTLETAGPLRFAPDVPRTLEVSVQNDSSRDWWGFDVQPEGLVELRYFFSADDRGVDHWGTATLALDVPAGKRVRSLPEIVPRVAPGSYRLCLDLVQRVGDRQLPLPVPPVEAAASVRRSEKQPASAADHFRRFARQRASPISGPSPCARRQENR